MESFTTQEAPISLYGGIDQCCVDGVCCDVCCCSCIVYSKTFKENRQYTDIIREIDSSQDCCAKCSTFESCTWLLASAVGVCFPILDCIILPTLVCQRTHKVAANQGISTDGKQCSICLRSFCCTYCQLYNVAKQQGAATGNSNPNITYVNVPIALMKNGM